MLTEQPTRVLMLYAGKGGYIIAFMATSSVTLLLYSPHINRLTF